MDVKCRRKLNGRYVVESVAGDSFEFLVFQRNGSLKLRMVGPPHWRTGPWPDDTETIVMAARALARHRARADGNLC